jgi:hypothetical protein
MIDVAEDGGTGRYVASRPILPDFNKARGFPQDAIAAICGMTSVSVSHHDREQFAFLSPELGP